MTHQDDISAMLKAKLEDRNPKCWNCRHWGCDSRDDHLAPCQRVHTAPSVQINHYPITTNLSVCSAWEKRDEISS